jgi:hypothetical protein
MVLMKNKYYLLLLVFFLIGCKHNPQELNNSTFGMWKYADVRLLDPVDTLDPERDLIALYTRDNKHVIQIRIDFLDLDSPIAQDIYIPIDTNPGGSNQIRTRNDQLITVDIDWDYLIFFSASGNVEIMNSEYFVLDDFGLFVILNSFQDNIILSFNHGLLPAITSLTKIQVIITPPDKVVIDDQTEPFFLDGPPPSRAKVLFMFWNMFYSSTPAEALRSWAGAHSGPMSSRHGLKYLIDFADRTSYPIFILDVQKPETMSVFDYLGVEARIESLVKQGQIVFSNDVFVTGNYKDIKLNNYYNLILGGYDYAQFINKENSCFSVTKNTFTVNLISDSSFRCKTLIISNGYTKSPNPIILGGDFQVSMLGDPAVLYYLNSYIDNHPWIQVLSGHDLKEYITEFDSDLLSLILNDLSSISSDQAHFSSESNSTFLKTYHSVFSDLINAPKNQISALAWQVYDSLSQPETSEFIPLSGNYVGQIGHILAAARWIEQPESLSTCTIDLDYDGEYECVLANSNIFLTLETKGVYIPFVFFRDENGPHQIIGPTWQFMLGVSDPSEWDFSLGISSDPGQILGAFVDEISTWDNFEVSTSNNRIEFINEDLSVYRSFMITNNKIIVEIKDERHQNDIAQIPLVLDPWTRYTKDWGDKYTSRQSTQGIEWKIITGLSITIQSNQQINLYPFNATHDALIMSEDPNLDYGRGHYLPFPIALAEIQPSDNYTVTIIVSP